MKNCKPNYTITSINDLDIDDLSSVPDYFLGVRTILDPADGQLKSSPVRVPGAKVMPTGSFANVVALETNNVAITVPDGQVRAGYMDVQPGGSIMRLADKSRPAQFLMVSEYTNGKMLIQTTGFLRLQTGHQYIVGQQYYTGADGQPVTDSTSGQKLFMPLDEYTLNVNGDF